MDQLQLLKKTWKMNESEIYPVNIPKFPGFYNSILEFPDELELNLAEENYGQIQDKNAEIFFDCIDYHGYMEEVGRLYTQSYQDKIHQIADFMKGFSFEFVGIDSPREYNFSTDKLAVNMKAKSESIQLLIHYCINQHRTQFDKYLKENFSHRDGFWSFWPNNVRDWWKKMGYEDLSASDLGFMIINMIEFVLEYTWEDIDEPYFILSQNALENVYASNYIDFDKFEKETGLKSKE